MKKVLAFLVMMGCLGSLYAQAVLRGRVITSDSKKPVALANVYLASTSVGTVTGEDGAFTIAPFPGGRYELIVSYIGYEPYRQSVSSAQLPPSLVIELKPRVEELQEVVLLPFEKDGWLKWGKLFAENFIGTSTNARECRLLNEEAVKFRYNKKQNLLQAFASEPLVFENRALGYRIRYDLTRFEYDFSQRIFLFEGFPFFEELQTSRKGLIRQWARARENAYRGSLMHFMRSLYSNTLLEDHFEVRRLFKISDAEKKRVRDIYRAAIRAPQADGRLVIASGFSMFPPDTAEYYKNVLQQPDKLSVLVNQVLPGDSIAYGVDSFTAALYFQNHLQVVYKPKRTPAEYSIYNPSVRPGERLPLTSEITLTIDQPIEVLFNGSYFSGLGLLTSGYWGWWEKVGNMLPYHYKPSVPE